MLAQQVRVLAAKPDDLSYTLASTWWESRVPGVVLRHTHKHARVYTHKGTHVHTHMHSVIQI